MMYFREDAKRPMSCSREHFESEWDRIFGKNGTDGVDRTDRTEDEYNLPGIDLCAVCKRSCANLVQNVVNVANKPSSIIEYSGYCTVKNGHVFNVKSRCSGLSFNVILSDYDNENWGNITEEYRSVQYMLSSMVQIRRAQKKIKKIF